MRFMKLKEVIRVTRLSRATIYRLISSGEFPKQIPLGDKSVAWLESEVYGWMENRISNRSNSRV
jgi:prophage regulatory protein